jgi:hypothetical protein
VDAVKVSNLAVYLYLAISHGAQVYWLHNWVRDDLYGVLIVAASKGTSGAFHPGCKGTPQSTGNIT